jgi:hypothetical protein
VIESLGNTSWLYKDPLAPHEGIDCSMSYALDMSCSGMNKVGG